MTARKAVAYYRVSSDPQVQFGWSLERQQKIVREYALEHGLELAAERTEVESAYRRGSFNLERRPGLRSALGDCKAQKAMLLVATLDRLSRNVVLVATLMESRIEFVALDMPDATPFMLHIFAAIAEEESRQRGRLIKAAKALSKARGKIFVPNLRPRYERLKARDETYRRVIEEILASDLHGSHRISKELRRRNVPPPTRCPWEASMVARTMRRLGLYEKPTKPGFKGWIDERRQIRSELSAIIGGLRASGLRGRKLAKALNDKGLRTAHGMPWTRGLVAAYMHYRPRGDTR